MREPLTNNPLSKDPVDHPERRWIVAYDCDDKKLESVFCSDPTVEVILTPTRKVYKKDFFAVPLDINKYKVT